MGCQEKSLPPRHFHFFFIFLIIAQKKRVALLSGGL